ncbi:MAG: RHS repeat protein [candidate division Zixibacteria bacterium]|nr:RHS repeat protein [candidate division Zixibacteria bacterium]
MKDGQGRGWLFGYDFNDKKKSKYAEVEGPTGIIREYWFDDQGVARRVDVNGRTFESISSDGGKRTVVDSRGVTITKYYDEWDNLTKVVYPDGSKILKDYDQIHHRLKTGIDERGVATTYKYDNKGNMAKKTEGEMHDRVSFYTYDNNGNMRSRTLVNPDNTVDSEITMTYDSKSNMTSITDAEGGVTRFTYDIMGNVLTREDPRGKITTYEYDLMGRMTKITDPLGHTTLMEYDAMGNKIKQTDPAGRETIYTYDLRDNLIRMVDAAGGVIRFEYDAGDNMTLTIDPEGKKTLYEYDNEGRLRKTMDGAGNEIVVQYDKEPIANCNICPGSGARDPQRIIYPTFSKEFSYDARKRKIAERDVLSESEVHVSSYAYDPAGNLISKTDKESNKTRYEYDSFNRLLKVIDPLGGETRYAYDIRDNLTSLTDANGNTTRFEYDRSSRLIKDIRPMGQETRYAYDSSGNLIEKIDAKGQKAEYIYDDANRLILIHYFNSDAHANVEKLVSFTYDKAGKLITYDDGVTTGLYIYDAASRKVSETVDYGDFSLTNIYCYYKNGSKWSFTGPDDVTYQYYYDEANRLTSILIPDVGFITYSDYDWGRPSSIILPGGTTRELIYDHLMRINSIEVKSPDQNELMNYKYTYDKMSNILSKETEHGRYTYGYDDLYRLTSAANSVQNDEAFTYDAVGNRLTSGNTSGEWTYNANNELKNHGNRSYVYDVNGNMTQKTDNGVVTKYFYNIEDRLVRVENGFSSIIAKYYYDPFGRRLWKDVNSSRIYFHYAKVGLVGEYDANGAEIKTYGYTPDSIWTSDPLFLAIDNNYFFFQNDHLGAPIKSINIKGEANWAAKYSSFGMADVGLSQININNLRFPGQYYDQETGLHYNKWRYYDSSVGRYLKVDPIGSLGGINFFNYAMNNPINNFDQTGLIVNVINISEQEIDISHGNVKKKAIMQILNNQAIQQYLNNIMKAGSKCKKMTLLDFISDSGEVDVNVYITDSPFYGGPGLTHWPGVALNSGWSGKVPARSIGLNAKTLFQSDFFDTDSGDERDAAEILIHEFVHWLTYYCLGSTTGPEWKGCDKEKAYDEGKKVEDMIDW